MPDVINMSFVKAGLAVQICIIEMVCVCVRECGRQLHYKSVKVEI